MRSPTASGPAEPPTGRRCPRGRFQDRAGAPAGWANGGIIVALIGSRSKRSNKNREGKGGSALHAARRVAEKAAYFRKCPSRRSKPWDEDAGINASFVRPISKKQGPGCPEPAFPGCQAVLTSRRCDDRRVRRLRPCAPPIVSSILVICSLSMGWKLGELLAAFLRRVASSELRCPPRRGRHPQQNLTVGALRDSGLSWPGPRPWRRCSPRWR